MSTLFTFANLSFPTGLLSMLGGGLKTAVSGTFSAGLVLSLSLIMSMGPQNVHVLRMGLARQHVALTVAVSVLADFVLIALGVLGLSTLGGLSEKLEGALVGGGVLFLLAYGWKAALRFARPELEPVALNPAEAADARPVGRWQATLNALAFSWLNPHAWLDTAVLIGTASLAYGKPDNAVFGMGAAAGSLLWFCVWGVGVFWLGRRLGSPVVMRALDGMVAVMMTGTAVWLVAGLM